MSAVVLQFIDQVFWQLQNGIFVKHFFLLKNDIFVFVKAVSQTVEVYCI